MRHIRDNHPPEALIRCLALRRQAGQALDYDEVGRVQVDGVDLSVRAEIRRARIADQGGICAYTMMRIDAESCHNEHLVPRSASKSAGRTEETLDYQNIVACYPMRESAGGCGFGAAARGTRDLAVTPLDPDCEQRIKFNRTSGRAEPTNADDRAVGEMLDDVLVLNHATLVERRLEAFDRVGVGTTSRKAISANQAATLAETILEFRRGTELAPYCVAIAQAAQAHAELIQKRRRRRAARG